MAERKTSGQQKATSRRTGQKATSRSTGQKAASRSTGQKAASRSTGQKAASRSTGQKAASRSTGQKAASRSTGQKAASRSSGQQNAEPQSSGQQNGTTSKRLSGREAIEQVRRELPELLGRPIEGVLGLESDDGGWMVTVQVVELARIPRSTDVLGAYEVTLDSSGELTSCRLTRRIRRGQADEG
jgi:gas vesicle protein GvpO